MTIPVLLLNTGCQKIRQYNIMDIAPTVAELLGIEKPLEWKGKSLLEGR